MPKPMMDREVDHTEEAQGAGMLAQKEQEQPSVDPKIQEQFDMFMSYGIKIIHQKPFTDTLVKFFRTIKDSKTVIDFVGKTVVDLVLRIEAGADNKGVKIDPSVLINAANQLMGEILLIGETVGMKPLSEDEKAQSFALASSQYLDAAVKSGRYTPEEIQAAAENLKKTPEGQKIMAQQQKMGMGQQTQQAAPGPMAQRPIGSQGQQGQMARPMPQAQQKPAGLLAPRRRM